MINSWYVVQGKIRRSACRPTEWKLIERTCIRNEQMAWGVMNETFSGGFRTTSLAEDVEQRKHPEKSENTRIYWEHQIKQNEAERHQKRRTGFGSADIPKQLVNVCIAQHSTAVALLHKTVKVSACSKRSAIHRCFLLYDLRTKGRTSSFIVPRSM